MLPISPLVAVGVHALHLAGPPSVPPRAPPPPAVEGPPDHVVYGYLPYWVEGDLDVVPWEHLTHLAIFCVETDSSGSLSGTSRWTGVAAEAVSLGHAAGVKVHVTVVNFEPDSLEALLSSTSARAALVEALGDQVDAYGADGVNVDFEGVPGSMSAELVDFTRELRARVGEVWLATPAVDWEGAYDYSELTREADGLFIMGYGYHWTGGGAGPNAPLDAGDTWSQWSLAWTIDDYLAYGADPDRVVMGLPLYGQAWPVADSAEVPADTTGDGWSVVYTDALAQADSTGRQWEADSSTPWTAPDGQEQLWYDDADSLAVKMAYAVDDAGLAGVGFWALGYDGNDAAFWAAVDDVSHDDPPADTGDTADTDSSDDADSGAPPPRSRVLDESAAGGCGCGAPLSPGIAAVAGLAALLARRRG